MHSIKKIIAQFFRHGQMSRYDRGTLLMAMGDGRGKRSVPYFTVMLPTSTVIFSSPALAFCVKEWSTP